MWLFFGISAIIFTGFNLIYSFKNKNEKWFRFAALSFTALTVCSFYSDGAMRVLNEDWGGLMDIMPTMSKALWVCVGISILLNSVCNGVQREHNKKLNNGLPILHKVPPKRDYGRYFCIMAEKGGTFHGGLTEKLSLFFHAKKQEVNAYGR